MNACCEEQHGQKDTDRYDPCFTAQVCFTLGLVLIGTVWWILVPYGFPPYPAFWKSAVAVVLLLLGIAALAFANLRVRFFLRTGRWAQHPSSKAAIVKAFTGPNPPRVAGEGWSWIIARERNFSKLGFGTPGLVALRGNWSGFVGRSGETGVRVKSGTLFGEMTRIMCEYDLALYDRPQFDQMTVAGGARTCAHGWSTEAWFVDSIESFEAVEKGTGRIMQRHRDKHEDFLTILLGEDYVLLELVVIGRKNSNLYIETRRFVAPFNDELDKPVPTGDSCGLCGGKPWCHRSAEELDPLVKLEVDKLEDLFLSNPFALLFIYPDCILYKTGAWTDNPREARISNCALRIRYIQRILGWSGDWSIVDSIADAHTIVQNAWTVESGLSFHKAQLNVELYATEFDIKSSLVPLTKFHIAYGGRTEFRLRVRGGKRVWALDATVAVNDCCRGSFSDATPPVYEEWFRVLYEECGVRTAATHIGKHCPPSLAPIKEVTMEELWSNSNIGV